MEKHISEEFLLAGKPERLTRICVMNTVDSTNICAAKLASENAPEGTLVISGAQTAGHGKYQRKFFSPDGCGLYMSIILRPEFDPELLPRITTAAAVAAADALNAYLPEKDVRIKWVNDLIKDGKKVGGILTETKFAGGKPEYAILGIGLNLRLPNGGMNPDIADIAGAVFEKEPCGFIREEICLSVCRNFFELYKDIRDPHILEKYRDYSCLDGKRVKVTLGDEEFDAEVIGIGDGFELIADRAGETIRLNYGEVSIKSENFLRKKQK